MVGDLGDVGLTAERVAYRLPSQIERQRRMPEPHSIAYAVNRGPLVGLC